MTINMQRDWYQQETQKKYNFKSVHFILMISNGKNQSILKS